MNEKTVESVGESPVVESPVAGTPAVKKARAEVFSKDDLVATFAPVLEAIVGARLSKQKVWDTYKAAMGSTFSLCAKKSLSLSGVGKFYVFDSQRSLAKEKPAKRLRFRPSSRVIETLNSGGDFLAVASAPEVPEPAAPVASETTDAEPPAPVAATVEL